MNLLERASKITGRRAERLIYDAYLYAEHPLNLRGLLDVVNNYLWHGKITEVVQDYCLRILSDFSKKKTQKLGGK